MCVVSMISDHFHDRWPNPVMPLQPFIWPVTIPGTIPLDVPPPPATPLSGYRVITAEEWAEYQALKAKAAEYDKRTGQPDCEKPEVAEWEERIEAFLIKRGLLPAGETKR